MGDSASKVFAFGVARPGDNIFGPASPNSQTSPLQRNYTPSPLTPTTGFVEQSCTLGVGIVDEWYSVKLYSGQSRKIKDSPVPDVASTPPRKLRQAAEEPMTPPTQPAKAILSFPATASVEGLHLGFRL